MITPGMRHGFGYKGLMEAKGVGGVLDLQGLENGKALVIESCFRRLGIRSRLLLT